MKGKTVAATLPAVAAALLLGAPAARAEGLKIAVVDLNQVVAETEDGKTAMKELETYFKKKQESLDGKSETLKTKMDEIKKKQKIMEQGDYQDEVDELQAEIVELQNTYMKYQKQVAKKEMDLTEPILEKVEGILKKLAESKGFAMILRKEAVAWLPDSHDVTKDVIALYNKEPPVQFKKDKEKGEKKDKGKAKGEKAK